MRVRLILVPIFLCALGMSVAQGPSPNAEEVVANVIAQDTVRETVSGGYSGSREYVLQNHRLQKRAQMQVRVTCDQTGTKHFEVLSEDGWKSANKHVLRQMLVTESDSSRPDARPRSRITSDNYTFRLIGTEPLDGRTAFVIDALPKREDKSLFRGRVWVDTEDYALARVEGEPAKSPSFWIRKVHFVQQYSKSGVYWFPMQTTSVTEARVFGTTDVSIRYFDYKPAVEAPTQPANPIFMEARYAKR